MRILFRVDAGEALGLGNFYRSVELAERLAEKGKEIYFTHLTSDFWDRLKETKFKFRSIEIQKAEEQIDIIRNLDVKIFYVDGIIDFENSLMQKIREKAKVVFYQNLSSSRHLSDIYFLPSLHQQSDFFALFNSKTKIYQGLQYFTFNSIIKKIEQKKVVTEHVKKIALVAGASDPMNTLQEFLGWIDFDKFQNINFTFFYGSNYMYEIPTILPINVNFELFNHSKIVKTDLLISAFGVSTYEFIYLGLPIISYGHQESNTMASDYLHMHTGAIYSLGNIINLDTSIVNSKLTEVIHSFAKRKELVSHGNGLLDLLGTERIASVLESIRQ